MDRLLTALLIRLYPPSFRARYEAEMRAFLLEERRSGAGGATYWLGQIVDHGRAALAVRRRDGGGGMRGMMEDLKSAVRSLRRAPAFTLFAVFTLSLGIGSTTAAFSVLDRVVFRPLPYAGSERMARVGIDARHDPGGLGPLSGALVTGLKQQPGPAEAVVAASTSAMVLDDGGEPTRLEVVRVTDGFFSFFDARPAEGRLTTSGDHAAGAPRVAVLGHGFWQSRYGGDPAMVGRSIRLDDDPVTVVGVLGVDFTAPPDLVESTDIWIPLSLQGETANAGSFYLAGVVRIRPGASLAEMDAHVDRVVDDVYGADRPSMLLGGSVRAYRDDVIGSVGSTLARVFAAVALLLVIACVNVASLLLTRGTERAQELAIRVALGSGRTRLVRHLLAESALLALMAGLLGGGLAWATLEAFRRYAPPGLPRLDEVAVDGRGLAFALSAAMLTAIVFGLLPALRSARSATAGLATPSRRATPGRSEAKLRSTLVALETALAVMLAVGSGFLAHDLVRLTREDPGFRMDGLVTMRLDLGTRFPRAEWAPTWERLVDEARRIPGVTAVAAATQAPYAGTRMASLVMPEGVESEGGEFVVQVVLEGDYSDALGAPIVAGRGLVEADREAPVALVNEAFAARYWPGESATDRSIRLGGPGEADAPTYEVVGVVADVRTHNGRSADPHVFLPLRAAPWRDMELLVRTEGDPSAMLPELRTIVRSIDPSLPITRLGTVGALAREGLARPRFYAGLFTGFALIATVLAIVGVYGTTSFAVRARVREIGVRLALGARREQVVASTVGSTTAVVAAGVSLGLAGGWLVGRAMGDALVYVTPRDSMVFAAVAVLVLSAGAAAAWVPARRAARIDPATTLREE